MDSDFEIQAKLDQLNAIEKEMEIARPRNQARGIFLVLFLLAVSVGVGIAVSVGTSVWRAFSLDIVTLCVLATTVAIILPRRRLRALERERDRLLDQVGPASSLGELRPRRTVGDRP